MVSATLSLLDDLPGTEWALEDIDDRPLLAWTGIDHFSWLTDSWHTDLGNDPRSAYEDLDPIDPPPGTTPPPPNISVEPDDLHLLTGFLDSGVRWQASGAETIITYSFPKEIDDLPAGIREADQAILGPSTFTAFSQLEQFATTFALNLWSEFTNVVFEQVAPDEGESIFYHLDYERPPVDEDSPNRDGTARSLGMSEDGLRVFNRILVDPDFAAELGLVPGAPGFRTMLHEIGHSLGLSHPGDYNATDTDPIVYPGSADYREDTHQYTIMSYFGAGNTGANHAGNSLLTPRTHDIYVIQQMYGVNWDTRIFDSTYGYNASLVPELYNFDTFGAPVMTIWDAGGEDMLNLNGGPHVGVNPLGVAIDLRPGHFSSTHGMSNNISLAHIPADLSEAGPGNDAYIENARGGDGDDLIAGNAVDNTLWGNGGDDRIGGGDGDDTLHGGSGDDTLIGGLGDNFLNGGDNVDTVDYNFTNVGGSIRLASELDEPDFGGGIGTIGTAELGSVSDALHQIENVRAGRGNDFVEGSSRDNVLDGNRGDDLIRGLAGDDTLIGGRGRDILEGGDGRDELLGGFGNDILRGQAGIDDLDGGEGSDTLNGGDNGDLLVGGPGGDLLRGQGGNDTLRGDEGSDMLRGGTGSDRLFGGDGGDDLRGHRGHDVIFGEDGNDTVEGGSGDDSLFGDEGTDTLTYIGAPGQVRLDLNIVNQPQNTGSAGVDSVAGFEMLIGSLNGDILRAASGGSRIDASAGNDVVHGRAGSDLLEGGAGADIIHDTGGNDVISGGVGTDTVSYMDAPGAVQVDLDIETFSRGAAGVDTLLSIENAQGGAFGDFLAGTTSVNELRGLGDNDLLFGRGSNDRVYGGLGDDFLDGGSGNDLINGGSGSDTASWIFSPVGIFVDLAKVGAQEVSENQFDTLELIENLFGSAHADILFGDDGDNVVDAAGGADVVRGRGGDDRVVGAEDLADDLYDGDAGTDTIDYGGVSASLVIALGPGQVTVGTPSIGTDILESFENVVTGSGDDVIEGDEGPNVLEPGAGTDSVLGNGGNDTVVGAADGAGDQFDGGDGIDTITYRGLESGVSVVLGPAGAATGGGVGSDVLAGFENATGGLGDDTLTGDALANVLSGGDGNDSLAGGAQDDTLIGGAGGDLLEGEEHHDTLFGGDGNDILEGGSGLDELTGEAGTDTFRFLRGFNIDRITDFDLELDLLDFSDHDGVDSFADLDLTTFQGEALVRAPFGGRAILEEIEVADLEESMFIV